MSNVNLSLLCVGCFSELEASGIVCPYCGYDPGLPPDSSYRLQPRTILNGKYMVGKVLGEGGFGITYIGYDLNLEAKVAVKEYYPSGIVTRYTTASLTVQPAGSDNGEHFVRGRERFVDEAKRLARFRSLSSIVMVNDFFVENGTAYIVMEYVEGQTLKSYLAAMGGKLPAEWVFEMMKPVFASLAQVHENGIIHRDISPDNIMITRDGSVKLLDFGAAREFAEDGNKSLSVMLKHGYAPSEQYTSKGRQGPHTDVYALSATIYKAITGMTPENSMDRMMEDTLEPPSRLGINLPNHQEAALMKGLAIRQENRYQTISELSNALWTGTPVSTTQYISPHPEVSDAHIAPLQSIPPQPAEQPPALQSHPPQHNVGATQRRGLSSPSSSNKPKIIAAVVAAVLVIFVALALTLPGSRYGNVSTPPGESGGNRSAQNSATSEDITEPTPKDYFGINWEDSLWTTNPRNFYDYLPDSTEQYTKNGTAPEDLTEPTPEDFTESPSEDLTEPTPEDLNASNTADSLWEANLNVMYFYLLDRITYYEIDANLMVDEDSQTIRLICSDSAFFETDDAVLLLRGYEILDMLIEVFFETTDLYRGIHVEGHMDSRPINNPPYSSNLEVSHWRAVNILGYMRSSGLLNETSLSARGYGDQRPIAPNDSPEGMAANRRMEFVIVFNLHYFNDLLNSAPDSETSYVSPPTTETAFEIITFGGNDWLVLDVQDDRALILSEKVLEQQLYRTRFTNTTWENSSIRGYLNRDYYNSFSPEDRARITETVVTKADNPWYGTSGGNDTVDRIFLLSLEEVVLYFGDSGQLWDRDHPGNEMRGFKDQFDTERIARNAEDRALRWWLRTPGNTASYAVTVFNDGYFDISGRSVTDPVGVRPALWLNLLE